ncbi:MAG: LemA protein [Salibacteraceae bacterium]
MRAKNVVDEAFSGIDVQLKKRFELIPNLIEAVKGYNEYEATTLEKIVEQRAGLDGSLKETAAFDSSITSTLKRFRIQVEAYPDLKANSQFLKLMDALSTVENELSMARRYFNGATRDLNIKVDVFPNVLIAKRLGFKKTAFYEINENEKSAPSVSLNKD